VATLASYPGMMQRARKREGLPVCRAAWLVGLSVREYREFEAGQRFPDFDTWDRICKLNGWPQTFLGTSGRPWRWRRRDGWPRLNAGANTESHLSPVPPLQRPSVPGAPLGRP
jgi:hypothetical protein